jgi:hypothetical protein
MAVNAAMLSKSIECRLRHVLDQEKWLVQPDPVAAAAPPPAPVAQPPMTGGGGAPSKLAPAVAGVVASSAALVALYRIISG